MRWYLVSFLLLCTVLVNAQSDRYLKSKLAYCTVEILDLEGKVNKYKDLLTLQTKEVQGLKASIQEKNREIEKMQREKRKMEGVAVNLINVALKLEAQGDYRSAMEIYKILIKSYPKSLEAVASRIKVTDLTRGLEGYNK